MVTSTLYASTRSTKKWPSCVFVCYILALILVAAACGRRGAGSGPRSPQEELRSFHLQDDFNIQLFASESDVMSPVEMVFDENGRIYVAEMLDYPADPSPGKPARSRIRLLETNDDGRIIRSTIFAENVLQVSGIMPWKGGLIVTSAPDILYMKDTNGDGKADVREVLYTGFLKGDPEVRITNPRLGIDNWIYCSNDGQEGRIKSPKHPDWPPVSVGGADFRFRLDRDGNPAEPASGPTEFGSTFDVWGNRFISQNTMHIRHVVVPMQYLARSPLLDVGAVALDISDHGRPSGRMYPMAPPPAWRVERTRLRQQAYRENHMESVRPLDPSTEMAEGYFTAASGGTIYSGDQFPGKYQGNLFTGDVSGNLIHRDILTPDGVTFIASRAPEDREREFLAATDPWFRPCNFANAPDGNLYVMDIYREFIETPESIPATLKKMMNLWNGDTTGRIYRLVPKNASHKRSLKSNLGSATIPELVKNLENSNGWHRDTAHRLLIERQDATAVPFLKELLQRSQFPPARIHALWVLESLSAVDAPTAIKALRDPHPRVREHAVRVAEALIATSRPVAQALLAMTSDSDARVQYQLAFTLGQLNGEPRLGALAEVASHHANDHWFRIAILSSVHDAAAQFFDRVRTTTQLMSEPEFLSQLASLIGAKHDPQEIAHFLRALPQLKQPDAGLSGLSKGLRLSGVRAVRVPGAEALLMRYLNSSSEQMQEAAWETARYLEMPGLTKKATADALASDLDIKRRTHAVQVLRSAQYSSAGPVLRKILESQPASELQSAAIESLAAFDDPDVAPALIANWNSYDPKARKKALSALLNQQQRVPVVLQALKNHQMEINAIDAAGRARLFQYSDRSIAESARRLFQSDRSDRASVVERYRDVLQMDGDPAHGKKAFEETCGKCHLPRKQGGRVGPDLSGISNKTKEELLTSILNPSYAIEPQFTNYIITTKDGSLLDGIIVNQTPGTITVRGNSEQDETLLRKNIVEIRASKISLMPDDLEKSLSRKDLADVISYLEGDL
jgi:putative membrane-bound dehydrogenase-like protein